MWILPIRKCAESVPKICVSAFFLQKARAETRNDGAGQKYTFTKKTKRKLKLKRTHSWFLQWQKRLVLSVGSSSRNRTFTNRSVLMPRFYTCETANPAISSGSRNRAWTHSKMIFFQTTSNDKVSHFKIAYTCDTLHRSIQFQTWNLHKNAWNFMKLHRPTQFQTWHLHKNMKNCIARQNFKHENDVFSNENGGPGILEFCWQRRPSKCIKKTSWFML